MDTESFGRAMRRVLRQDPDVILIGEMRDEETVRTALSAAETGHLVLSTLHTLDATETVNRIIDFFPPHLQQQARVMLSATLRGVVGQRLVPRLDGGGRVAVCEVLVATGRVQDLILNPKETGRITEVIAEGEYYGMQTFDQALLRARAQPATSPRTSPSRSPAARTTSSSCSRPRASAPAGSSRSWASRTTSPPAPPRRATPAPRSARAGRSRDRSVREGPPNPASFPEALAILALRAGVALMRFPPRSQKAYERLSLPRWLLRGDHLRQVDIAGDPRPRRLQSPLLRARALASRGSARARSRCGCGRSRSARSSSATPTPRCRRASSTRSPTRGRR